MERLQTIAEVVAQMESTYSNQQAFNLKQDEGWISISTSEFLEKLKYLTLALNDLGIKKGDTVGILADSTPSWNLADMAIMLNGAICVPLFGNISHENFVFEVEQSGCKTLFFGGQEPKEMLVKHKELFTHLIDLDNKENFSAINLDELIEKGKEIHEKNPDLYMELRANIHPDDICTIIYTSGSTGVPKGACHTHGTLFYNVNEEVFHWSAKEDRYLSFLPLAHVFARMLNFAFITWGVSIYYITDVKKVADACKEVKPTLLIVVPRLLEKIYAKMLAKVEANHGLKKKLGLKAFQLANKQDKGLLDKLLVPIFDKLVYSKLRDVFGGKLRVVLTGGAKLNPGLNHFFVNIGLPLFEGYGMTEAGMMSVNKPGQRVVGSIGLPLTDVHFKLTDQGEILVKSGSLMKGYYKNEEETKKTFTEDGWLKTGDQGTIDEKGYLHFSSRLKEVYKSSTGEYICPIPMEMSISKIKLVDMCMVVADDRKFASCLIFPDFEAVEILKKELRKTSLSNEEFLESDTVQNLLQREIDKINDHLNHHERIRAFKIIMSPPTIQTGELTPTMKIKRNVISKKYSDLIDLIYEEREIEAA